MLFMVAAAASEADQVIPPDQSSRLVEIIQHGDSPALLATLAGGFNVNATLSSGDTLLIVAVAQNNRPMVEMLLARGARVGAANPAGWTPLMIALYFGHHDLAVLLLEHHAAADTLAADGMSPRALAEWRGDADLAASLPVVLPKERPPAGTDLAAAVRRSDHRAMQALLSAHVSADALDDRKTPVLISAALAGDLEGIRILLHAGAHPDLAAPDGTTALMAAAFLDRSDIVATLLEAGADPAHKSVSGATAISAAVRAGATDLVIDLGKHLPPGGPDPRILALAAAAARRDAGAVQTLLAQGVDPSGGVVNGIVARPLVVAAYAGAAPVVDLLLARGAAVDAADARGNTALIAAVSADNHALADRLIAAGANPKLRNPAGLGADDLARAQGWTELGQVALFDPGDLMTAAVSGDTRTAAELLDAKNVLAAIDTPDGHGWTPLMYAAKGGSVDMVGALLKAGASSASPDPARPTPLMIAAQAGARDSVALLLSAGADPYAKDRSGATAEALARSAGRDAVVADLQAGSKLWARRISAALMALGYMDRVSDQWSARIDAALARFRADFVHFAKMSPEPALRNALASTARVCNVTSQPAHLALGNDKRLRGWFALAAGRCMWVARETAAVRPPAPFLLYAYIGSRDHPSRQWGGATPLCVPASERLDVADPAAASTCAAKARSVGFRRVESEQMRNALELK